jgi:flagellar motility protein MotE (MotC chaperone)
MRILRLIVAVSLAAKLVVLGTWWTASVVLAEAPAGQRPDAGLPKQLLEQSAGFREMLNAVAERSRELDERERKLAAREAGLASLEQTVAEEVARLEALTGVAPEPAPAAGAPAARPKPGVPAKASSPMANEERVIEITRIFETMKAEEAAGILDKADDATLEAVLGRMKERQIGAILAAMNREKAVALTKLLAGTRGLGESGDGGADAPAPSAGGPAAGPAHAPAPSAPSPAAKAR